MASNWHSVHIKGLVCVNHDKGIEYLKKPKVSGLYLIPPSDELNIINRIN